MNEKSPVGSSRNAAAAAAKSGDGVAPLAALAGAAVAALAGVAVGENVADRPGLPPRRPPDRLSQPSTLSLKKSVRIRRLEVMPPCECPTSQNALMFSLPICSMMKFTMFCRYSSSAADHTRVGEFGVAMTRWYLSL